MRGLSDGGLHVQWVQTFGDAKPMRKYLVRFTFGAASFTATLDEHGRYVHTARDDKDNSQFNCTEFIQRIKRGCRNET